MFDFNLHVLVRGFDLHHQAPVNDHVALDVLPSELTLHGGAHHPGPQRGAPVLGVGGVREALGPVAEQEANVPQHVVREPQVQDVHWVRHHVHDADGHQGEECVEAHDAAVEATPCVGIRPYQPMNVSTLLPTRRRVALSEKKRKQS